jgi:hypothetical protein
MAQHPCLRSACRQVARRRAPCKGAVACAALRLREADRLRSFDCAGTPRALPSRSRSRIAAPWWRSLRARWPAPGRRFSFPSPSHPRRKAEPHVAASAASCRGRKVSDDRSNFQYRACRAECRSEYLRQVAHANGLQLTCVCRVADRHDERGYRGACPDWRRAPGPVSDEKLHASGVGRSETLSEVRREKKMS